MEHAPGATSDKLIEHIRDSVIGGDEVLNGPFGPRPVVYADYTASGRSLTFIEEYIRHVVLPLYANTHTEASGTGLQTTRFREEARDIIGEAVGATREHAVLFCGTGATGAISKLIGVLGLRVPSVLDDEFGFSATIEPWQRPVVFIGPYEHHSNELPWRESIADVVIIDEDEDGHVSMAHLERELIKYRDRPLRIGSFSAASNVTGIITDTVAVSALLHHHGALSFWDFAAAGPYVGIDMGSSDRGGLAYKDAVFLSPHKFIGGPQTPGVLVARRELFANRVPESPGGGTVRYVSSSAHDYDPRVEHREEAGTPAIVGAIRAGLVFQLKEAVGVEEIARREHRFVHRALESLERNPNIELLGNHEADRLSIVSFVVRHNDRFLHHNYVVALLNDLFGIQARGGCSCAGPYGHRLLGIDLERSHEFQREVQRGCEGIKPGWVRVNFNYFIDDATFQYIIDAIDLIATRGAALLPHYRFEPDTGMWQHTQGCTEPPMSLRDISYSADEMTYEHRRTQGPANLRRHLTDVERLLVRSALDRPHAPVPPHMTPEFESLRWFPYPVDEELCRPTPSANGSEHALSG